MVCDKKYCATIDSAGKTNSNRLGCIYIGQPILDFLGERSDIIGSQFFDTRRKCVPGRRKETFINGVRIGAANEVNLDNVMGGNHAGVRGVELLGQPLQIGKGGLREGVILDLLNGSIDSPSERVAA